MKSRTFFRINIALIFQILVVLPSFGGVLDPSVSQKPQETAYSWGYVMDETRSGIPDAKVTFINRSLGTYRSETQTIGSGLYSINNLPSGHYTVVVTAKGYGRLIIWDVSVGIEKDAFVMTVSLSKKAQTFKRYKAEQFIGPIPKRSISLLGTNPPLSDIRSRLERTATQKRIPRVILKAIAWQESKWKQFRPDGSPLGSFDGGIGIMQITDSSLSAAERDRLANDIDFNISKGADVLINKWNATPIIGDGVGENGRLTLENWYYAIWAYNGFTTCGNTSAVTINNPCCFRSQYLSKPYQEEVLDLIASPPSSEHWEPINVSRPVCNQIGFGYPIKIIPAPQPLHIEGQNNTGSHSCVDGFDYAVKGDGYYVAQDFGNHLGEDWNWGNSPDADIGKPVYAIANGRVTLSKDFGSPENWGQVIMIQHVTPDGSVTSMYAHLNERFVSENNEVKRGDLIGSIGKSGGPWPPYGHNAHLHLELDFGTFGGERKG